MPVRRNWTDADAAHLRDLRAAGLSLEAAAKRLGVSRSFAQKHDVAERAVIRSAICGAEREAAGDDALPPGHPISRGAIALPCLGNSP